MLYVGGTAASGAPATSTVTPAGPPVVVSLTWDDGRSSQVGSVALQQQYGFPATYYINSGDIGTSSYNLSKSQLDQIAAAGNEIGGHTQHHEDLTTLSPTAARTAVCGDRTRLVGWYGPAAGKSFAYPFGAVTPAVQALPLDCGYQTARGVGGLRGTTSCLGCPFSETLPPVDPSRLASMSSVSRDTTLAELQNRVLQAESAGGGWLIYTLHDLGVPANDPSADPYNIDPAMYSQFLSWLAARSNVQVKTVAAAMAGPAVPAPPDPSQNLLQNSSLERDDNANGVADCWQRSGYGINSFAWTRTANAHSGSAAEEVTITSRSSGDRKLVTQQDSGACAPSVQGGAAYRMGAWYQSTVPVAMVVFYRDPAGVWNYWQTGAVLPATSTWSLATMTPGPLPSNATAVSFGIALTSVGTLRVDDLILVPAAPPPPDTTAPVVTLTQPADQSLAVGTVNLAADASDDRLVSKVEFFAGSQLVGTDTVAPYTATWSSTTVADGPVTVTARATDGAGNVSATSSRTVNVSNAVPPSAVQNPSMETVGTDGAAACFSRTGYGTNAFVWSRSADAHTGTGAEQLTMTSRTSGDRKLMTKMDNGQAAGGCAPDVAAGHAYQVSGWYKSTAATAFIVFVRDATGSWVYWQTGPVLPATSTWTQATYTTPAIPVGATAISFGLYLGTPGTLIMDDYALTPSS